MPDTNVDFADSLLNAPDLERYYAALEPTAMGAGWAKREPSMYPEPKKLFVPAHWSYRNARAAMDGAARLVGTEHAERRNLICINPIPGNGYATNRSLVAAYQMIKGHEVARSHRHTANAMRFILDTGPECYTVVEGMKVPMIPGDVLMTPNWCWHGHNNVGPHNAYWIDFLDAPLAHLLGPMFFEQYHDDFVQKDGGIAADSPFRYPFDVFGPKTAASPEIAPGVRQLRLGPPFFDTMRLAWRLFAPGATLDEPQTTASVCYAVQSGHGSVTCDGVTINFARGDVFNIPQWQEAHWDVPVESYVFRVSDENLLEKIHWLHSSAEGEEMAKRHGSGQF